MNVNQDMYINYGPTDCCEMDRRVIEVFKNVYEKGMREYDLMMVKIYQEEHKQEVENGEKVELARLKAKYEQLGRDMKIVENKVDIKKVKA